MDMLLPANNQSFVGRQEQINLIEDRIGIICHGDSVFQTLINFYGVAGIGKTWLLQELRRRIRAKDIPCGAIDLSAGYEFSLQGKLALTQAIASSFGMQAQLGDQPEAAVQQLTERIMDLTGKPRQVAVLLIDTLEHADTELLDWLEDTIVSPLIRTERVMVLVASRVPHRWKRFEVRRRAYQQRIEPFDSELIEQQVPQRFKSLVPGILCLTKGHPFANRRVIQSLEAIEKEIGHPIHLGDLEKYRERLVRDLVDQLIEPEVMADVPSEIKRAYRVLALVRHFDVNVLRRLLSRFVEDPFAGKSAAYFLGVVGEMVKSTLVEWSSDRRGYVLEDTIRWMLALHMRLSAQETYERIQRELVDLYEGWIREIPENRHEFIIERLYHQVCLMEVQGANSQEIANQLDQLLESYLQNYRPATPEEDSQDQNIPRLKTLKDELSRDEDLAKLLGNWKSNMTKAGGQPANPEF